VEVLIVVLQAIELVQEIAIYAADNSGKAV